MKVKFSGKYIFSCKRIQLLINQDFVFFNFHSYDHLPSDLRGNCLNNFPLATSVCLNSMALTNCISRWNFSFRTHFGWIMSVGENTDTITLTIKVGIGLH